MPEVPEDSWEAYVRTIVEIVRVGERDLVAAPRQWVRSVYGRGDAPGPCMS